MKTPDHLGKPHRRPWQAHICSPELCRQLQECLQQAEYLGLLHRIQPSACFPALPRLPAPAPVPSQESSQVSELGIPRERGGQPLLSQLETGERAHRHGPRRSHARLSAQDLADLLGQSGPRATCGTGRQECAGQPLPAAPPRLPSFTFLWPRVSTVLNTGRRPHSSLAPEHELQNRRTPPRGPRGCPAPRVGSSPVHHDETASCRWRAQSFTHKEPRALSPHERSRRIPSILTCFSPVLTQLRAQPLQDSTASNRQAARSRQCGARDWPRPSPRRVHLPGFSGARVSARRGPGSVELVKPGIPRSDGRRLWGRRDWNPGPGAVLHPSGQGTDARPTSAPERDSPLTGVAPERPAWRPSLGDSELGPRPLERRCVRRSGPRCSPRPRPGGAGAPSREGRRCRGAGSAAASGPAELQPRPGPSALADPRAPPSTCTRRARVLPSPAGRELGRPQPFRAPASGSAGGERFVRRPRSGLNGQRGCPARAGTRGEPWGPEEETSRRGAGSPAL